MYMISYSKISSENELAGHICGEPSIDKMAQESYYPNLMKQQNTYCIKVDNDVVGSFAIVVKAISFEDSDKDIADYYDKTPDFGVIEIKYLAVDSDLQGYGIGTAMLQEIVKKAQMAAEKLPIRCLVFKALRNKVTYYQRRGFVILSESEYRSNSETVRMFFDLMTETERKTQTEYCCRIG